MTALLVTPLSLGLLGVVTAVGRLMARHHNPDRPDGWDLNRDHIGAERGLWLEDNSKEEH